MNRRQFLYGTTAVAMPVLVACDNDDEPIVSIDKSYPVGPFDATSTAEEVTLGLDLTGKTVIVTGCNSGLGLETMRVLALRGVHVIGTGINTFGELELVNGVERTFAVNHLGHFILVNRLMPMLKKAQESRIVHVGSMSAYVQAPAVGIDFDNLRGEGVFDSQEAYGRSKLANALFSLELATRLEGSSVTSNVIHPGLVKTNIARTAPIALRKAFDWFGHLIAKTVEEGAATQVYVATNPALKGVSGAYFEDCNAVTVGGDNYIFDKPMAEQLWSTSEQMAQGYLIEWE